MWDMLKNRVWWESKWYYDAIMEQREIYERFKRGAGARAKKAFKAARLIQKVTPSSIIKGCYFLIFLLYHAFSCLISLSLIISNFQFQFDFFNFLD